MSQELNREKLTMKMEELGLGFMSAGLESFLSDVSRKEQPFIESVSDLIDLEYYPRKERMAKTRLKVS